MQNLSCGFLYTEIIMWFIIYRNYHVVPWQDWSSAGVDPDFPTKALFFFFFYILQAVSRLDAGGWHFFPGRVSGSTCISLSLLMESLLKISNFISQKMPSSSIRHFVLIDLTSVSVQVTSGLGEEPKLRSDGAGLGQSCAWYLHELWHLVDGLLNKCLYKRDGRSVSEAS